MTARRHHYLSQCYLKAFAVARKKSYHTTVFDARTRRIYQTNVENVGIVRDFNRIQVEGYEPDTIEKALAEFEGELGPALERVITARTMRSHDDRALILNFMCMLAIRTPRLRETMREFTERVSNQMMQLALATKERWEGQVRKATAAGYMKSDRGITYEQMKEFVDRGEYRLEIANEHHLGMEFNTFDKVLETFFGRKWVVLRSSATSGGFIARPPAVPLLD